jgi:hypothetical protein
MAKDMIDDITGGKQPGNKTGLPTGKEVEEAERVALVERERLAAEEATRLAGGGSPDEDPNKVNQVTPEVVAAIQAKVEKNEELTLEESQILLKIDELIAEPAPVTYKVGDRLLSREEAEAEARAHVNIGNVKLAAKAVDQLIEDWVKIENQHNADVQIDRGFQGNAQDRKTNLEMAERNRIERARLDGVAAELARQRKQLNTRIERAQAEIKIIQEKYGALIKPEELSGENGQTDIPKLLAFQKQESAVSDFNESTASLKELDDKEIEATQSSVKLELQTFIAENPQYEMSMSIGDISARLRDGLPVSQEDEMKYDELYDIISHAKRTNRPMQKVFEYRKNANTLAVKPTAHRSGTSPGSRAQFTIPTQQDIMRRKLNQLGEKVKKAPASIGGGGGGNEQRPDQASPAKQMVEEGRRATGKNVVPILRELGYK